MAMDYHIKFSREFHMPWKYHGYGLLAKRPGYQQWMVGIPLYPKYATIFVGLDYKRLMRNPVHIPLLYIIHLSLISH